MNQGTKTESKPGGTGRGWDKSSRGPAQNVRGGEGTGAKTRRNGSKGQQANTNFQPLWFGFETLPFFKDTEQ